MLAVRRLFSAVLELALDDLRAGIGRHPKSQRGRRAARAAQWLFEPGFEACVSFGDVCAAFGRDPERARMRLKEKLLRVALPPEVAR